MTRIIGGTAGGRTLRTPTGGGTRPTSDRVREALFSSLDARDEVEGMAVLDLYAGSGALGLEAASRGARSVTLVESDRSAAATIRANLEALGLTAARVVAAPVATFLARGGAGETDLVLLDPPYDLPEESLGADLARLAEAWLAPGALVVVERSKRSPEPAWSDGLTLEAHKKYGETVLWLARMTVSGAAHQP